eukprot:190489_1
MNMLSSLNQNFTFLLYWLLIKTIYSQTILTNQYGGNNGNSFSILNQGRISGISKWGRLEATKNAVCIETFTSDNKTLSTIMGTAMNTNCTSFSLSNDEYIDGYRVVWGGSLGTYLKYIGFHTSNNETHKCHVDNYPQGQWSDSGWHILSNVYLTGFEGKSDIVIDSIAFQFTNFTSAPTLYPTTEPTTDPTTEPTTEPTTDPITEPTTDPTHYPTAKPTPDPSDSIVIQMYLTISNGTNIENVISSIDATVQQYLTTLVA